MTHTAYKDESNPPPNIACEGCSKPLEPVWMAFVWMRPCVCDTCHTRQIQAIEAERRNEYVASAMTQAGIHPRELERAMEATGGRLASSVRRWCDDSRAWAWVTGDYGTGKSTQAVLAARYYAGRHHAEYGSAASPRPVIYATEGGLLDAIKRDGFDAAPYARTPRLIIDEVGREKHTDWSSSTLRRIIDDRYRQGRATMLVSNMSLQSMLASASASQTGAHGLWDVQTLHRAAERATHCITLTTSHRAAHIRGRS